MARRLIILPLLYLLARPALGLPAEQPPIPMADYLTFLGRIAPAAEQGARDYLAAFARRCGRELGSDELRRALAQGDGDPVLMGLIRASYQEDTVARMHWVAQIGCPTSGRQ